MSIAASSGSIVTIRTLVYGAVCENQFLYYNTDPEEQLPPQPVADYFEDTIVPYWQSLITSAVPIISLKVETTAPAGFVKYPVLVTPLSAYGTVNQETMPPFVAMRLIKTPDVANQDEPGPEKPWRLGSTRISGIPEDMSLSGGFFNTTYSTAAENLASALLSFQASGQVYRMYIRRYIPGDEQPDFFVPVDSIAIGSLLTTQNTRKLSY
jgi:hypothetical protein